MSILEIIGRIMLWAVSGVVALCAAMFAAIWLNRSAGKKVLAVVLWVGLGVAIIWIIWGALWVVFAFIGQL